MNTVNQQGQRIVEEQLFLTWDSWNTFTDKETGEKYKSHFTNRDSAQPITFPYTPERKYMERVDI